MVDNSLKRAAEMLKTIKDSKNADKARLEKDRQDLIFGVGKDITDSIKPALSMLVGQGKITKQDIQDAMSQIKITNTVPDIKIPEINVPTPRVNVTVPRINIPAINMPDEMSVKGAVTLMGIGLDNPLPVQLRTADGGPLDLFKNLSSIVSSGGGGGFKRVTIDNTVGNPVNVTGSLTVSASATTAAVPTNNDGVTYNSDNPLPVTITSGASATSASNIVDSTGVAYTGSNPVPVYGAVSGTVAVSGVTGSIAVTNLDGEGNYRSVFPVEGTVTTIPSGTQDVDITANSIGLATSALQLPDGHNVTIDNAAGGSAVNIQDGGNTITVDGTVTVGSITATTAVALTDSTGVQYSGSNRVPTRSVQARGSLATAYVSLANGTETTLLVGVASEYHDLVWVMGANQSDVAITLDFRASTAGNIVMSLELPASGTAGIAPAVPYPQTDLDASWTIDMPDDTGAVVDVTALFSKEV